MALRVEPRAPNTVYVRLRISSCVEHVPAKESIPDETAKRKTKRKWKFHTTKEPRCNVFFQVSTGATGLDKIAFCAMPFHLTMKALWPQQFQVNVLTTNANITCRVWQEEGAVEEGQSTFLV